MTQIKRSVIIMAPVQKVFKYASDYHKWSDWYEGVSNFSPITIELPSGSYTVF